MERPALNGTSFKFLFALDTRNGRESFIVFHNQDVTVPRVQRQLHNRVLPEPALSYAHRFSAQARAPCSGRRQHHDWVRDASCGPGNLRGLSCA
eukprot:2902204-Rhodomonas_salina.2